MNSITTRNGLKLWSKYDLSTLEKDGALYLAVKSDILPESDPEHFTCKMCGADDDALCASFDYITVEIPTAGEYKIRVVKCMICNYISTCMAVYASLYPSFRSAREWSLMHDGLYSRQQLIEENISDTI